MKRILLLLILSSVISFGQNTKYLSERYEFSANEVAYMFGNDVKLRESPNTESEVLTLLKIGSKIEVLLKTEKKMLFDGLESPWYKIKYKDKVGYVLGCFISLDKASFNTTTYLISLKKDGATLFLKTRLIKTNNEYLENISKLHTHEFSIKTYGNKGLKNVESIFKINYLAESCGINSGGIYLFFNGSELIKAIDFTKVADADAYWYVEDYIFPTDEGGMEGKILYKREIGETIEYETEWVETKHTQRVLKWNGKEVLPKIESKKN